MKKLVLLLSFAVFISLSGKSQTIKGVVLSGKDHSAIEFATVALLKLPDSTLISGAQTQAGGNYSFSQIKPGNYFIKASFLGYSTTGKTVTVGRSNSSISVDTKLISEISKQIEQVVVNGDKIKGKEMVDRTVFAIPAAVAKTSSNGYDVLKKIPSVQVDFQNNITLNGSGNFIIQVDGKQRDKEFLSKLEPTDIESIEIINNPSGKYEGTIDGVINVILKKEARYGMNGNIDFSARPAKKPSVMGSGSLEYSMGKISFYVSAFSFNQELNSKSLANSKFLSIDSLTNSTGNGNFKVSNSSINTGFDYYINDKNSLSLNLNFRPIRQTTDIDNATDIYKNNVYTKFLSSVTGSKTTSNEGNASLFYRKQFKKPIQEFTNETNYYLFKSTDNNDFTNTYYNTDMTNPTPGYIRDETNISKRSYFSSKFDYVHPLGFSSRLETGYQIYYQDINYNFRSNDASQNNDYQYGELRNAAYVGFTTNVKKFGFQATLRVENSDVRINHTDSLSSNYFCFLPSANFQYKINSSQNVKLTYNRRINRPSTTNLNPFIKTGSDMSETSGNANLKPEYRDKFQLTYTLNLGSNYISPSVYYEKITDKVDNNITQVKSPITNTLTRLSTPDNILTGYEQGVGLNAMLWFFNVNARVYKGHYDEYKTANTFIAASDYSSFSINSYAFAPLPKKFTVFAFFGYNGVTKTAITKTYNMAFYGFGGRKELGNHSFGIFYLLPFSKTVTVSKSITNTSFMTSENRSQFDVSYYIQVSYSYRFHQGRDVKKVNKKVDIESDSKAGGINN
jgi:outer membrane receptor protein involved in Fe transport